MRIKCFKENNEATETHLNDKALRHYLSFIPGVTGVFEGPWGKGVEVGVGEGNQLFFQWILPKKKKNEFTAKAKEKQKPHQITQPQ